MVEATIVAPVFVILLLAAVYLHTLYEARSAVRLQARACAWEHALSGCGRSACGGTANRAVDADLPNIKNVAMQGQSALSPFEDIPIVGAAFDGLLGTSTQATATQEVPFPFDETRVATARGTATVACNSQPTSVLAIATDWIGKHLSL